MIGLIIGVLLVMVVILFIGYKAEYQECKELKHIAQLEQKLSERPLPKADPEEQGTFVRTRRVKRATPETYRIVFDLDVNGQRVLEHLTQVFAKTHSYLTTKAESVKRATGLAHRALSTSS